MKDPNDLLVSDFRELYIKINLMMAFLGAEGEVNTMTNQVGDVMDALYNLDDGVYDIEKVFGE